MNAPNAPHQLTARTERSLDKLAILDEHGHRLKIHPGDADGRFHRGKTVVRWLLIGVFVALPWIDINGHPAVLLDVPTRHFYLFGRVFGPTDAPFLFFLLTAIGFTLITATTLFGRVWCGWACPQTVYLEAVFRRIERLVEGPGHLRLQLDAAPWSAKKLGKRALKWGLWLVASFLVAHVFLSYFVSIPRLAHMVVDDPRGNWATFLIAAFATSITYFNFAWFREQTCLIICPYGRLQSVMQDRDSITIGYDKQRGEPRGKKSTEPNAAPVGDCVDCRRCVQVCPTGIDIRNGLQMECIGCAACIDACDEVMDKLHRPRGLVRYDSLRGLDGEKRKILRPRLFFYGAAGGLGLAVLLGFALTRTPFVARITRPQGLPFRVENGVVLNQAMVHVENRSSLERELKVEYEVPPGINMSAPQHGVRLPPQGRHDLPIVVQLPTSAFYKGMHLGVTLVDEEHHDQVSIDVPVLGPLLPK